MPLPRDYMARVMASSEPLPEPSRVWHDGNTTGTVPAQHSLGPYQYWRGALVYDPKRLLRMLTGDAGPLDTAHPAHVPSAQGETHEAAATSAISQPRVASGTKAADGAARKAVGEE